MDFTQQAFDQGIAIESPELNTGLTDDELNMVLDQRIRESKTFYETMKLDDRRRTNEKYWLGEQVKDGEVSGLPFMDNVLRQDLEQRIKLAVGRVPDIIVTPGDDSLNGRQDAKKIERVLDIDLSTKEKKRLLKNGLRHNHLFFIGACKAPWNPNKGMFGDYEFNLVDPRKLLIAHNATIPEDGYTADNCDIIAEIVEEPVATVLAKFPHRRQQLMEAISGSDGSRLVSSIKYQEIWYTYHSRSGQIIEGVCWRYNHVILRNMRNPYFDFQGYDRMVFNNGQPQVGAFGQPMFERVFRNYFDRPRKPYIFFSYENLGRMPLDDTTVFEQCIPLQRNLNKAGKQIRDICDGVTNKYAFNNRISQDQARLMTSNPKEPIWVDNDEDVRASVQSFTNDGPPASLFQDVAQLRQQIDAKFNTQGNTRGELVAAESGVSKQITREGDLVTSDDIVEIVIERVIEEMAGWALQHMKLNYRDTHFKSKMGKDGEAIQEKIQRDDIGDGVAVTVRSSVVDKSTARNMAISLGESGAIDPLTMFEELDVPNPKERAQRLLLFKMGESETGDGFASYMNAVGMEIPTPATPAAGAPAPGAPAPGAPGVPPDAIPPEPAPGAQAPVQIAA